VRHSDMMWINPMRRCWDQLDWRKRTGSFCSDERKNGIRRLRTCSEQHHPWRRLCFPSHWLRFSHVHWQVGGFNEQWYPR